MYYYVNSIILTTLFLLSCLDDGDDGLESLGVAEDGEEVVEEDSLLGEVGVRLEFGLDQRQPRVALVVLWPGHV